MFLRLFVSLFQHLDIWSQVPPVTRWGIRYSFILHCKVCLNCGKKWKTLADNERIKDKWTSVLTTSFRKHKVYAINLRYMRIWCKFSIKFATYTSICQGVCQFIANLVSNIITLHCDYPIILIHFVRYYRQHKSPSHTVVADRYHSFFCYYLKQNKIKT
jgi:hypothetical protein